MSVAFVYFDLADNLLAFARKLCEVGLTKPDPRLYHLAAERCGRAPAPHMMAGDSIRLEYRANSDL